MIYAPTNYKLSSDQERILRFFRSTSEDAFVNDHWPENENLIEVIVKQDAKEYAYTVSCNGECRSYDEHSNAYTSKGHLRESPTGETPR
jgi:hypothetical protein